MLMFALNAKRVQPFHSDLSGMVLAGDLGTAFSIGNARMDRPGDSPLSSAMLANLMGRILLAIGREEDAQEAFERAKRNYRDVSRSFIKAHSTLDQGAVYLHLNRPGRAAECFSEVADDTASDISCRVDGLAGLAVSMLRLGELRTARRAMTASRQLCASNEPGPVLEVLDCLSLEIEASASTRCGESLSDHALWRQADGESPSDPALLRQMLDKAIIHHSGSALIETRLKMLRHALPLAQEASPQHGSSEEMLGFLQRSKMQGFETSVRIELALGLLAQGINHTANDVLKALIRDEQSVRRNRYSLELEYCLSKLYQAQGRPAEALRAYKLHSQDALNAIRKELARVPALRTTATVEAPVESDAAQLRLPLRYRKAYQYMLEHIADATLSVREVAEHIGVTERALQIAFRTYLGETPAEVIRSRRMVGIRSDLQDEPEKAVLDIATRWGMRNRSTLAQAYRRNFQETPSQTRRDCEGPAPRESLHDMVAQAA